MVKVNQIFKCEKCGSMVEGVHAAGGTLSCCKQPMTLIEENSQEAAVEKHIPVVEKTFEGILVKVGEVEHPMTEEHSIEWVEVLVDDRVYRHNFKAGDEPHASFKFTGSDYSVRAYCNLHGLWTS